MQKEDALDNLLHAVKRHRLAFLYLAFPNRNNPENPRSRYETVYQDELPRNQIKIKQEDDEGGEFLFEYDDMFDHFADLVISRFGPGEGYKPTKLCDDGKEIEIEGGSYPYWTIDDLGSSMLNNESDRLFDICRQALKINPELRNITDKIIKIVYPPDQKRWSSSIVVPWKYLDNLDKVIFEIKKVPLNHEETDQVKTAKKLIKEIDKLISMEKQYDTFYDHDNKPYIKIKDANFWLNDIFKDDHNIISDLTKLLGEKKEEDFATAIQTGIEEIIAKTKSLMLDLKPGTIYQELNWLVPSVIPNGLCTERLRIWKTFAYMIIKCSSNPNYVSEVSIASQGITTVQFMLVQLLYNIMSCIASSKMIWADLDLNLAYLWVIEKLKKLDTDVDNKIMPDYLPERIPMSGGEDGDIEWGVMWENHWQSDIANVISKLQKELLIYTTPIPEDHEWSSIIKQHKDRAEEVNKIISKHNHISENAFEKLADKLPKRKDDIPTQAKEQQVKPDVTGQNKETEVHEKEENAFPLSKFKFNGSAQVFYDDKDLGLPTGEHIEKLKIWVDNFETLVSYEKFGCKGKCDELQGLKNIKLAINKRFKILGLPFEIKNVRTEGYFMQYAQPLSNDSESNLL